MDSNRLAVVAFAVGAAGLLLGLIAVLRAPETADEGDHGMSLLSISARLDAIEERLGEPGEHPPMGAGAVPGADREELAGWIREETRRQLEKARAERPPPVPRTGPEAEAAAAEILRKLREEREAREGGRGEGAGKESLADLQARAMDTALDETARVKALRQLRGMPGGQTRDVVLSMIELYRSSKIADVRADVFRQMSKVREPELRDACIDALRSDPARKVREEAAETLGGYRDDPAARDALERAAESDAEEDVRKQAKKALEGDD